MDLKYKYNVKKTCMYIHACFYIVIIFLKIPACNYTIDPLLTPTHTTTPVPNLTRITPQ